MKGGAQLVCLSECFAFPYGPQYFRLGFYTQLCTLTKLRSKFSANGSRMHKNISTNGSMKKYNHKQSNYAASIWNLVLSSYIMSEIAIFQWIMSILRKRRRQKLRKGKRKSKASLQLAANKGLPISDKNWMEAIFMQQACADSVR